MLIQLNLPKSPLSRYEVAGILFFIEVITIPNILLDKLPQDYDGYLIRTDFGIGVQITLCASDTELLEYEKAAIMLNLLFGRGMPDYETAMKGLHWFMSCGREPDERGDEGKDPVMSFDFDDIRIYSAFRKVFGIDLTKERLHWFQFISMLQDIEGSALSDIMGYRAADLSKMQGEQRAAYAKMKRRFALPNAFTEEEQGAINEFLAQLNPPNQDEP